MKWQHYILFSALLSSVTVASGKSMLQSDLRPDHFRGQFAGNIGFLSLGAGYSWLNNHVASDLLVGYVPEQVGGTKILKLVQKNTVQFNIAEKGFFSKVKPLTGFSVNFETGRNSYVTPPDKYPAGYYGTNAFTFSFFTGVAYEVPFAKENVFSKVHYYAEVGTLATYLYYDFKRREYLNPEIWSLALGLKFTLK